MNFEDRVMLRAIELAKIPAIDPSPNPRVGAVLTYKNTIVGMGFHKKLGGAHAEVEAIRNAENQGFTRFSEASLFVTLEPCCHENKRTPPCVPFILEKKIKDVVCAHLDPNPKVSGRGISKLKAAGVKVKIGVQKLSAEAINQAYLKNQIHQEAYITLKIAQSLDGKMATDGSESQWISSTESREKVHRLRQKIGCVAVGKNTIEIDNPNLNARIGRRKTKTRVVIFGEPKNLKSKNVARSNGLENILCLSSKTNLKKHLQSLYRDHGISHVLIEGGPTLATSFLEKKLVDEAYIFVAPLLIGGKGNYSIGRSWQKTSPKQASPLPFDHLEILNGDLLIHSHLRRYGVG